ncbi:MAG: prepilin-type N-terminal cleavage/methylation domain-containing protein [Gammaproteobacteria bacterium]|nr:prepilin-type N-terminal cleavage/methylation domain-containing protein [Gammaproteobacteria bacterium]
MGKSHKKQSGMTLIELVIIIIVLAIISAIAAPRFVDIKTDAVAAAQAGTRGGMMSAYTVSVGADLGTPTWTTYISKIIDMNCGAANGICDSADFDTDVGANADLQYQFYSDATCTTAIAAGADLVFAFRLGAINAAPIAADACIELR